MCGIVSDNVAQAASDNHNSLIIINPKITPKDHLAAIRLWGSPDEILEKLAEKLLLYLATFIYFKINMKIINKYPNSANMPYLAIIQI